MTDTAVATSRPSEGSGPVLSLKSVSKRFGAVQALTDVDLEVHSGEVVALVGDNGAGKSTLVKLMAGVYAPDSGQIVFDARPVSIPTPAAARDLGIATVFQDLALCDNLDVVANLFLGKETLHGGTLDEVDMEQRSWQLLRQLSAKIPSVRIPVASLSGGQRQTVAIARSLLGDPKVVMLDEPTAALGVAQTAEVLNLIERLRERGHAVIVISHNMADVQAVADRVAVLRLGRNNGVFRVADVSYEEIIAAITGASDNAVTRRAAGRSDGAPGAHAAAGATAEAPDGVVPDGGDVAAGGGDTAAGTAAEDATADARGPGAAGLGTNDRLDGDGTSPGQSTDSTGSTTPGGQR